MKDMRGSAPTAECLAQWGTTPAPVSEAPSSYEQWRQEQEAAARGDQESLLDDSFAAAVAFAALALFA
jgi:hypothetical protein